jgi:hypothetical protein
MSCGGGHLGFPIGIKNRNFVEDLPVIILGQFGFIIQVVPERKRFNAFFSETTNQTESKQDRNVHWMVLYKV